MSKRRKKARGARPTKPKNASAKNARGAVPGEVGHRGASMRRRSTRIRARPRRKPERRKDIAAGVGRASFDEHVRLGLLAPGDPSRNTILAAAGERYRALWREAGRSAPVALGTPTADATASAFAAKPFSGRQAACREEYRRAREALPTEQRGVVDSVLLAEADLATAGRNASGRLEEGQAIVVATDRLACGCAILARHFGMLPPA
jgi:hypothetical protein